MLEPKQRNARLKTALAILSFIPAVGLLIAPVLIVWGLVADKNGGKSLIHIGLWGGFVNLIFAVCLPQILPRRDAFHEDKHVKYLLPEVVESIEYLKSRDGAYPKTLQVFNLESMIKGVLRLDKDIIDRLHYEVIEGSNHYFLLGIGADNTPFTADDILPVFDEYSSDYPGLTIKGT